MGVWGVGRRERGWREVMRMLVALPAWLKWALPWSARPCDFVRAGGQEDAGQTGAWMEELESADEEGAIGGLGQQATKMGGFLK